MKDIFLKLGISLGVVTMLTLPFLVSAGDNEKVIICHMTGSETNPYVEITVSINALESHIDNHGDFILGPGEECSIGGPL